MFFQAISLVDNDLSLRIRIVKLLQIYSSKSRNFAQILLNEKSMVFRSSRLCSKNVNT